MSLCQKKIIIHISLQPDGVKVRYVKLKTHDFFNGRGGEE